MYEYLEPLQHCFTIVQFQDQLQIISDIALIPFNQAQYVKDNGLGGAMIWSVETDDFLGVCGSGKFPLLVAINSVLTGKTSGIQVIKQCCLRFL
jgi:hypothetical protein